MGRELFLEEIHVSRASAENLLFHCVSDGVSGDKNHRVLISEMINFRIRKRVSFSSNRKSWIKSKIKAIHIKTRGLGAILTMIN